MDNFRPLYRIDVYYFHFVSPLRLRMAQEIQRKLEETEVKQKDLENRGVSVEKALRGEGGKLIINGIK